MSRARRSLSSGATRPNTCSCGSCSSTWASVSSPSSAPVITPGPRPSSSAMARAVIVWSPVIMRTSTPAPRARCTASFASARSGSMMPTRATNIRSLTSAIGVASAVAMSASSTSRAAKARTRSPCLDSSSLAASRSARTCVDRHQGTTPQRLAAAVEHHVGRALHGHDVRLGQHAPAEPVRSVVDRGHELVLGVERHLGAAGKGVPRLFGVDADLGREHHERRLGRITDDGPVVGDGGVAAQRETQRQATEVGRRAAGGAQDARPSSHSRRP